MKKLILLCCSAFLIYSCACDESLLIGQEVQIPLVFENFSTAEINSMRLLIVDKTNQDTINDKLTSYLFGSQILTTNYLTDHPTEGYYTSDMDGKDIFFVFTESNGSFTKIDSLMQMVIKKSQGTSTDKCHENDPNISIDELSFVHNGQTLGKEDNIRIKKK
jgi:hypothetical protein